MSTAIPSRPASTVVLFQLAVTRITIDRATFSRHDLRRSGLLCPDLSHGADYHNLNV